MVDSVTLFYNAHCPDCRHARDHLAELLAERAVPFSAKEVTADVHNRDLLILTSGQVGAPVVLVDKREVVGLIEPVCNVYLDSTWGRNIPLIGRRVNGRRVAR
jgi:glutaredoxin-related protein